MWRGHPGRALRREAVNLRPVGGGQRGIRRTKELSANREAAVAFCLSDARLLQQPQRVAAGADEHELRVDGALGAGAVVAHLHRPGAVGVSRKIADLLAEQRGGAVLCRVGDQLPGQRPEIHVGAVLGPVQGDGFGEVAVGGHQRQPAGEFVWVVDELGGCEQRVARQRLAVPAQVVDLLGAVREADVRDRVEEAVHVGEHSGLHRIRPELARDLELLVDLDGLRDVDRAIGQFRGVVELAQSRVPGTRVVPRVAAFCGGTVQAFDESDRPIRFQQSQQRPQCGAHDPGAHQHDVSLVDCLWV